MTLKDLAIEYRNRFIEQHPNIPLHAVPHKTFNDRTANGLASCIKAFCDMRGVFCQRTGNEGRFRPGKNYVDVVGRTRVMKGTWLPGQNNGQGDISITMKGKIHWVEIKIGRDKQSDVQKTFESQVKKAGATYDIVKDWEGFYKLFILWQEQR